MNKKKDTIDKYNCPFCPHTTNWINNFKFHLGKEKKCNKDIDAVKYEEIIDLVNEHKGKREPFVVKNGKIVKIYNKEGIICQDCGVKLSNKRSIYAHKKNHCKKTLLQFKTEEEEPEKEENYLNIIQTDEKLSGLFNEFVKGLAKNKPEIKELIEEVKTKNKKVYRDYGNFDFDRFSEFDFDKYSPYEYVGYMVDYWFFNGLWYDLYCVRVPEKLVGTNFLEIRKEGVWVLTEKMPVMINLEDTCRGKMVQLCENFRKSKAVVSSLRNKQIKNFLKFDEIVQDYFEIINNGLENDKKTIKEFNEKFSSLNYNFEVIKKIINEKFGQLYCSIVNGSKKMEDH